MKIIEAINRIDALKQNTYSQEDKVKWLSTLDSLVKAVIDAHEGGEDVTFTGYDDSTDLQTELLAPAPHDEMYLLWIGAQIDYNNREYGAYNNSVERFNTSWTAFKNYYTRTLMPKGKKMKFF